MEKLTFKRYFLAMLIMLASASTSYATQIYSFSGSGVQDISSLYTPFYYALDQSTGKQIAVNDLISNVTVTGTMEISDAAFYNGKATYSGLGGADPTAGFTSDEILSFNLSWNYKTLAFGTAYENGGLVGNAPTAATIAGDSLSMQGVLFNASQNFTILNMDNSHYTYMDIMGGYSSFTKFDGTWTKESSPVPEPATFLLLGAGLVGIGFSRRKSRS